MVGDPTVDRAREMFIGAADGDEAEPTEPRTPLLPRGGSAVSARCTERCPDLAPAGRASALLPPRWARPPPSRGAAARAWASAAALRGGPGVSATGGSPSEAPGAGGAGPRAPSSSDPVQRRAGGARGDGPVVQLPSSRGGRGGSRRRRRRRGRRRRRRERRRRRRRRRRTPAPPPPSGSGDGKQANQGGEGQSRQRKLSLG
ncbi:unnamed protein product, partial [Prorocentrum cordatum]